MQTNPELITLKMLYKPELLEKRIEYTLQLKQTQSDYLLDRITQLARLIGNLNRRKQLLQIYLKLNK